MIKESVSRPANGFYVDREDSSITRTDEHFRSLFTRAGLAVEACRLQAHMPKGLFPVWMYALAGVQK